MDAATLTFVMNAVDNVSPTAQRIAQAQDSVAKSAEGAQKSIDSSSISLIRQLQVAQSLRSGIRGVTMGFTELGVVSDDVARGLGKVNALAGTGVGIFQLYKGVTPAIQGVTGALGGLLTIETMRSVLQSPWKAAGVGVAIGAGLSVAALAASGSLGGGGPTTNIDNTVTFQDGATQDQRTMSSNLLSSIGGSVR